MVIKSFIGDTHDGLIINKLNSCFKFSFLILMLSLIAACSSGGGDDGSGGGNVSEGVFLDSAVEGVRFTSATQNGFTDSKGTFLYLQGEVVSFYIGDILLGSASGKALITPLDFVPGAVDANNQQVTNILRFLQTLDQDSNPDNGIVIPNLVFTMAAGQTLDFTLSTSDFESFTDALVAFLTSGATTSLIDVSEAIAHFQETLDSIEGGGSVSVGGDFGSLTLSGPDTNIIGTSFTPNVAGNLFTDLGGIVSWNTTADLQAAAGYFGIDIVSESLEDVTFSFYTGTSESIFEAYNYRLRCLSVPTECGKVILDVGARTVTFDNVSLSVSSSAIENISTAPIEISGTLTW